MKTPLLVFFLIVHTFVFAQKFTLEGFVKDQDSIALEGATVYLQSISDSIPLAYGITNKNGKFSFHVNTEADVNAIFNVAYLGYEPYLKTIEVPKGDVLNMGTVILNSKLEELNVVSIIGKAPPVVIKKDTVEYNADSFKTLPNDKVEDLLKKLPGFEIDTEGNIKVNGIAVQAVNVDGMKFFGDEKGAVALKNIPSNVISKVQVTDYKTDLQKFTGEESDSGTKEVNLKIKKGKNKAYFGDVNLGYGTDDKYQANANLFNLIEGKQIGLITGANNINMSRGFNALPSASSSNGYTKSDFIGANFSKGKWDETSVNANYTYSAQHNEQEQKSFSENFLPNLTYTTNATNNSYSNSNEHSADSDLNFLVRPKNKNANRVRISNNFSFNTNTNESGSIENRSSQHSNGDLVSTFSSTNSSKRSNHDFNNDLSVSSRVGSIEGNYFVLGLSTAFDKQTAEGKNYSRNVIEAKNQDNVQDQTNTTDNTGSRVNFYGRLTKTLFKNFSIIPAYSARVNTSKDKRFFYDFNEATKQYDNFNDAISTHSKHIVTTIRPSLRLRYEYKEFRFEVGSGYTSTFRKYQDNIIEARNFKNEFNYATYSGRVRYRSSNGYKWMNLSYNQNINLPSMGQLQPVPDVSNITHIVTGNPDLKPAVNRSISLRYDHNIAFNNINISAYLSSDFVNDKIINATITDADLIRYTTYKNIDGDYGFSGNLSFSKSYFKKNNNFNLNLNLGGDYRNIRSIQNTIAFTAKTNSITPRMSLSYSYDKTLEVSTSYSYQFTKTAYNTEMYDNNAYFVQNLRFDSSLYFLENAFLSNKLSYRYNSRVGDDFDGAALFWNVGIGVQLWDDRATLTAVGYDILGKNNGFSRSVTENSIRDVENRILEQYFMLNFVYNFGRFAGENINVGGRHHRRSHRIR